MRAGVMTSRTRYRRAVLLILAAGFGLASTLQAGAQAAPMQESTEAAAEADAAVDVNDVDMKDIDIKNLDWSQLNVDASTLISPASKARAAPGAGAGTDMSWSSQDKPNGSAALSVKQPLSPFWDARVGADMTVVNQPQTLTSADLVRQKFSSDSQPSQSSGSAWAAITAPGVASIWDKTAIEARVDPSQEQSKLGTSLSKSLPLSEQYSLTLQNGYNVIRQGVVPVPGIPGRPVRNYETDQSARRFRRPTTDGCARSAPSRNCSAISAFRARSAKPRSAPRTRALPRDSSAAGSRWCNLRVRLNPGESSIIAAYWPRCGQNQQSRCGPVKFIVRGVTALAQRVTGVSSDERHPSGKNRFY